MEVRMDSPNKLQKYKKYISIKLLITQAYFELQTPDFAWKFVQIVQTNYKSTKVQKVQKYKNTKTQKMQICKKMKKT